VSVVVDAHQHFWDPAQADYPWMTDAVAPIRRAFTPEDLRPHLARARVDYTVIVQARADLAETRELLQLAARTDFVAGVVGWADLRDRSLPETLATLKAGEGGDRLVGIRHQVHDEPDPGWIARGEVLAGLRAVRDAGLVYDLLLRPRELPAALVAARAVDDLRFVIDHVGKPRIAAGAQDAEWERGMARFAPLEHVACKVSGMVTEASWTSWGAEDLAPYVDKVVRWFGEHRLLFGSDWPVCLLAAPYERVVETARRLLPAGAAFGANAVRLYGLEVAARSTTE
jgi:L-fuconolactonase